jgi:two-component system OmpR family sensor kinase
MTRVIDNLISNAIKYNKKGSFIRIDLKEGYLCIEDGGIGINADRIEQMYDRYSRFNESEGGFGLGLNIVSEIAKEYNLKLKIESKIDIGTKVIITWQK